MKKASELDKNLLVRTKIEKAGIRFYNSLSSPFKLYGGFYENGAFTRMPADAAERVSEAVNILCRHTAGIRLRFRTDSPYVAINAKMSNISRFSHFAISGEAGFDLYADGVFSGTFMPPLDVTDGYESIIELGSSSMREITVNLPLYSSVRELCIGLDESASVEAPTPYRVEKPVVFYGSSVTQGGCASRPGMSYENIVSRKLGVNYINLGFSGNALGEQEMAEYIKSLDMSAFVYDYDYNAPTPEHLEKTHESMFRVIREANPDLPIIIMTRPRVKLPPACLNIIKRTYENARGRGDENVYFLSGPELFAVCGDDGTVEGVHPTDLGFFSMAEAVSKILASVL